MSSKLRLILGFAVSALLLFIAFRNVDFAQVGQKFAAANLWLIIPAVFCSFIGYLLRARRWQSLLAPAKRIPFGTLFTTLILGFAANNVLPARVGELVRAHQIGAKAQISRGMAFSTIVVERVCDGFTLLAFMGLVLIFAPISTSRSEIQGVEYFSGAVFLTAGIVIVALLFQGPRALRLLDVGLRPVPERYAARIRKLADSLLDGLRALKSRRHLAAILGLSVIVWSLEACSYILVLLGLNVPLDRGQLVAAAFFLVVFVNLGIMIPSAPGYVGTFQLFAILALASFEVDSSSAVSVAILSHALQYLLVTGLGLVFFIREQAPFGRLAPAAKLNEPSPE